MTDLHEETTQIDTKLDELTILRNGVSAKKDCIDSDYDEQEEEEDMLAIADREDSLGELNCFILVIPDPVHCKPPLAGVWSALRSRETGCFSTLLPLDNNHALIQNMAS